MVRDVPKWRSRGLGAHPAAHYHNSNNNLQSAWAALLGSSFSWRSVRDSLLFGYPAARFQRFLTNSTQTSQPSSLPTLPLPSRSVCHPLPRRLSLQCWSVAGNSVLKPAPTIDPFPCYLLSLSLRLVADRQRLGHYYTAILLLRTDLNLLYCSIVFRVLLPPVFRFYVCLLHRACGLIFTLSPAPGPQQTNCITSATGLLCLPPDLQRITASNTSLRF